MTIINILGILSVFAVAFVDFYFRYLVFSAKSTIEDLSKVFWFLDHSARLIKIVTDLWYQIMLVWFLTFTVKNTQYILTLISLLSWLWFRFHQLGFRKYQGYNWELEVTEHILTRDIERNTPEVIKKHQKNFINLFWKNSYINLVILAPFVISLFLSK